MFRSDNARIFLFVLYACVIWIAACSDKKPLGFSAGISPQEVVVSVFDSVRIDTDETIRPTVVSNVDTSIYYLVDTSFQYRAGGQDHWLIIVTKYHESESCHACTVTLSQIQLVKSVKEQNWKLDFSARDQIVSGSWGQPGEVSLIPLDKNNYGILVEDSYMAQGFYGASAAIYFRNDKLLDLKLEESNEDAVEEPDRKFHYLSKISTDIESGVLVITRVGTMPYEEEKNHGAIVSAAGITRYKFVNGKYQKL